jgi:formylglycine-generating enzyme required for sulfatase activity
MTDIFISYSHQDEKWKDALQKQLRVFQLHADFPVWDDRQIDIGDTWLPRIEAAIAAAKVAILLISSDFLISEFVCRQEIPRFLQRRAADGLRVVPLVVEPCPWQAVGWLASLQGATKDNEPLSRHAWDSYALKHELSQVALKVYHLLQESRAEEERQLAAQNAEQARQAQLAREREQARLEAEQHVEQARLRKIAEEQARQEQIAREAKRQQDLAAAAEAKRVEAAEAKQKVEQSKQQAPPQPQTVLDVQQANFGSSSPLKLGKWALLLAGLGLMGWGISVYEPSKTNTQFPKMLPIPAGEFTMGCVEQRDNVEGDCYYDEKPPHPVKLSAFKLAETEVTVEQYLACVQQGGCPAPEWNEKGSDYNISTGSKTAYKNMGEALTDPEYPIVGVSWENAVAYTTWLNKSRKPSQPFRLPTEAEWEYAARGGNNQQAYPWGNSIGKNKANCSDCGDEFEYTAPVGSFPANGFGLKDMQGNVWEWVADWYGDYSAQSVSNPKGASKGTFRVLRGGSWFYAPGDVRSANRLNFTPDFRYNDIGFRVAQDQ